MTHDIQPGNSTMKTIKEKVDFIYELTSTPEGYSGSLHNNGVLFSYVATILLKRGILIKSGPFKNPNYKWFNPAMVPTKNLYKTIAVEVIEKERVYYNNSRNKQRNSKASAPAPTPVQEEPKVEQAVVVRENPLAGYSINELWDELKSRGCYIEDNRLAQKTVQFFD